MDINEKLEIDRYVRRRMNSFDKYIDQLEKGKVNQPIPRRLFMHWDDYQVIITRRMLIDYDEDQPIRYFDMNIHNKMMEIYGDRIMKMYNNLDD